MATGKSITYNGITWGFTHNVTYGYYINGDPWVLANPGGGVEVSSITPQATVGSLVNGIHQDKHGSQLNHHWTIRGDNQGMHGKVDFPNSTSYVYSRPENWAIQNGNPLSNSNRKLLTPGNSLVSSESTEIASLLTQGTSENRTAIKRIAILTCVSSAPSDGSFRPSYAAVDKTSYVTSSDLDYTILADIESSSVSSLMPSSTAYDALCSALKYPMMGFGSRGWGSFAHEAFNNIACDGYGVGTATFQNAAIAYVNTNIVSLANKKVLANYIVQRGIDLLYSLERGNVIPGTSGRTYTDWNAGGGHNNSFEAPLIFLLALLNPDHILVSRIKAILQADQDINPLSDTPIFQRRNQLFTVASSYVTTSNNWLAAYWSSVLGASATLAYQTSDVGLPEWAMTHQQFGSIPPQRKGWSYQEVSAALTAIGQPASLANNFYVGYRHCCTANLWIPLVFAYKVMGIEKLVYSDEQGRYVERYLRRDRYGPYPESFADGWIDNSVDTRYINDADTAAVVDQNISTRFGRELYEANIQQAFKGARTAGTYAASIPVSSVESIGISTNKNIYLTASAPLSAGIPSPIYCHGLSGFAPTDLMVVFVFNAEDQLDKPFNILGAKLYSIFAASQFNFTLLPGSSTGVVNIPSIAGARGYEYLLQALLVRVVNNELEITSTNALKVTLV